MPDRLAYAVRLALLAKSIAALHLPHFDSLEQSSDYLKLMIRKPRICLREAMEDVDMLEEHGHMLIKGLLSMLLELREIKATVHNLTPDGIFVSSTVSRLVLVDLFNITFSGSRVLTMPRGSMPYSNQDLPEHELTGHHRQERTLWSVGIMILELLVGQDVIKCLRTHQDVVEVVSNISDVLGQRLYGLICGLLFDVRFSIISETLKNGLLDDSARVKQTLKLVSKKVKESRFFEDLLESQRSEAMGD